MKAAIFNPYLDTLGGGERYTMAVATSLVKKGFIVDIEWDDISIKDKLEKRFGINLNDVNFINDIKRGDGYDVCFWVSDGSVPALKARKNFLHFQVPFSGVGGNSLINKFKLTRINRIIVNSRFTKSVIDKEFNTDSFVLYPPVDVEAFKQKKKENIILNVARFSNLMQSKRQDVLIRTFKNFHESNPNYKLILAGGVEVGADQFVKELEEASKGSLVQIIKSPDFKTLKNLYASAKVFWSASGYGINENEEPKKVEHFGITVVEAMAAGCIPVIYNAGGHKEIVKQGGNGFLWSEKNDLYGFTKKILDNEKLRKEMSIKTREESKRFSYEEFEKNLSNLL